MKLRDENGNVVIFFTIWAVIVGMVTSVIALWTDRTLDYWLTYFKGAEVDVPYWMSWLVTLFLNGITLGVNLVSEIVRLYMGG